MSWLTVDQVVETARERGMVDVSRSTVYGDIRRGCPCRRKGRRYYLRYDEWESFDARDSVATQIGVSVRRLAKEARARRLARREVDHARRDHMPALRGPGTAS